MTPKTDKNVTANDNPTPVKDSDPKANVDAKPKFDKDELLGIFDEMIFSGEYSEQVVLRNGKLKLTFRARSAEDTMEISKDIDSKNFTLIATLSEYRALLNLAHSLVNYAGKDLSQSSVEERTKIIKKLPSVVVALLSEALSKFDAKIDAACAEGEANF